MIVCQCESVNDAQVRLAIEVGALSISGLKGATRAGTDCGTCTATLCAILRAERPGLATSDFVACAENGMPDGADHEHHVVSDLRLRVVEPDAI